MLQLNVSIVLYNTPNQEVYSMVSSLSELSCINTIYLIDNSDKATQNYQDLNVIYIPNKNNLGYGKAHNIAIRKSIAANIPFHLVINSDIILENNVIPELLNYMQQKEEVGMIQPKVYYPNGEVQHLCKLLPTPTDLILRRFLPNKWTAKRQALFELHHCNYDHILNIPYLSGCFMLLRTQALETIGLFDERFFLYPEDIDLSRRMHEKYSTLFYPHVSVIHQHRQSSYKSYKLLWIHIGNMIRYFNKWGWHDKRRDVINRQTLNRIQKAQEEKETIYT